MPPDGTDPAKGEQPRLSKFVGKIADVEAADLTDKQLRAARRLAARRGIAAASDLDAVQQLKALVARGRKDSKPAPAKAAPLPRPEEQFDLLQEIETGLVARRRTRLRRMLWRLALFVLAPTLLVSGYFTFFATPMYATFTELVIQKPEGSGGASGLGLLAGFPAATHQESASVQGFLTSRGAMQELIAEQGFRQALSGPGIDPIQRLAEEAGDEEAFRLYEKRVRVGFDPNENVVRLQVIAPQPEQALRYAQALIGMAERQVDRMSQRLREDRMRGARDTYAGAEARLQAAQDRVLRLQQQRGVLSAELEAGNQMSQIAALQSALIQRRLELAEMSEALHPDARRMEVLGNAIARLEALIADLRGGGVSGDDTTASLARIGAELQAAQTDLQLRQQMLAQALQLMEAARIEANRQTIYLATSVAPVLPDEAAYPRALQNSLLAFLIFAGTYLMISMTCSILREQVSN